MADNTNSIYTNMKGKTCPFTKAICNRGVCLECYIFKGVERLDNSRICPHYRTPRDEYDELLKSCDYEEGCPYPNCPAIPGEEMR